MLFIPENELERALVRAVKEPASGPDFYRLLLESHLLVLGTAQGQEGATEEFSLAPGSQISLVTALKDVGQRTKAYRNPSYPFDPTVWIAVASNRSARSIRSNIRLLPSASADDAVASATAPPRTTLSTMITVPECDNRIAQSR